MKHNYVFQLVSKFMKRRNKTEEKQEQEKVEEDIVAIEDKKEKVKEKPEESITNKDFQEILNDVKTGSVIIAKNPTYESIEGEYKAAPFMIIGKDNDSFYAIKSTLNVTERDNEHFEFYDAGRNIIEYYDCRKIYKIGKNEFLRYKFNVKRSTYIKIIRRVIEYCDDYENIDFKALEYVLDKYAIILRNNGLYVALGKVKNKKIKIARLVENSSADLYVFLKRKKFEILFNEIELLDIKDEYEIIGFISEKICKRVKNTDIGTYDFGDVLSVKSQRDKVIYLTQIENTVYCASFDQLELFTGIMKIEEDKIEGFYRKLNDNEISRLVRRLEKPLVDNKYPIYYGAKDNILNSITAMKNNS